MLFRTHIGLVDISSERRHKPEHFGHFRFLIPVPNWQFWINVISSVGFFLTVYRPLHATSCLVFEVRLSLPQS